MLAACGPEGEPPPEERRAHTDLACAACHRGPEAARGRAAVPPEACTESGCHSDHGPAVGRFATVRFRHRDHGMTGDVSLTCAGCHTHSTGEEELRPTVDACVLCHRSEVAEGESRNCRLCHQNPSHVTLASQGAPVPHASLPSLEIGCTRCHYDVVAPAVGVPQERCTECHGSLEEVAPRGIGRDLHPVHDGLTCASCHGETAHRVQAMSAAVSLVCSDCHAQEHGVRLTAPDPGRRQVEAESCAACHRSVHQAQQRLVLGTLPSGQALPSEKFLAGMSCRSCHVPPDDPAAEPTEPIRGQADSCAGCHRPEYRRVLDWWLEGIERRREETRSYVDRSVDELAVDGESVRDTVATLLERADGLVTLVEEAGGQHNLQLADRIFRHSVDRAAEAYRLAGRAPPPRPELGTPPHEGLCSYCHYGTSGPWKFEAMDPGFHSELGIR